MTKKSDGRQARDNRVIEMQNSPPQQQTASFVLNSEEIPQSLFSFIKQAMQGNAMITLFPFVRTYSPTLTPLEFGKAVQIAANPHGQIRVRFIVNFDRKNEVAVQDDILVLTEFDELRDVWAEAFKESAEWKESDESD